MYLLFGRNGFVRESQASKLTISDFRVSDSLTDPSYRSYTAIRPGSQVVNSEVRQPEILQTGSNGRLHYQKTGRKTTDETMEYRNGKTILSVRNSIGPTHLSYTTSASCSTDTPESGELEQHIASHRANTKNLLEGFPSNTNLLETSNATAKTADGKCGEGDDLADLAQYVDAETCWPFLPSTSPQAGSKSLNAQKANNDSKHQQKYIPYNYGAQQMHPNAKAPEKKTPPPRPERLYRYSAVHPDGLSFSSELLGVALGSPSLARVPTRKPLPAHFLSRQSQRTSRHPDSLFMNRENSRLRRAQEGVSNLRDQFAADTDEHDLVPAPLIVSKASHAQPQENQLQRTGLNVAVRVPSPRMHMNFSRHLVTTIPSPDLHLSFSASVYNTDTEYGADEGSIITVALSSAVFPPEPSTGSNTL
ncbi:hypothetical protein EV356DRAFT_565359, partial [Viridothelium virens]